MKVLKTMDKRELELAAALLEMASDKFSNHGCNDYTLPESWTQQECDDFLLAARTWNGDPEIHRRGDRMTMDWFVMDYLAAKLKAEVETTRIGDKASMLGEYKKTERGFELIEFRDAYDKACSLQQSSAIGDTDGAMENPGSSFVWLGINDGEPIVMKSDAKRLGLPLPPGEVSGWMPYPIPEEVQISTRMHLNREQVEGLVERLQQWLETGDFETEATSKP